MAGYLKRLVSSLGAYQLADLLSKVMAILLLPIYLPRVGASPATGSSRRSRRS